MKNYILTFLLVFPPFVSFVQAQRPNLGTLTNFVLFTSTGAVGNTGVSDITGDVGTNSGAITGFEGIPGTIHLANATTAQGVTDVTAAYNELLGTPSTFTDHAPVFGNGETLIPGVYSIAAAASVAGSLTLDAQGDPNAIFIFKAGGALTTAAATTIYLTNSASANNIFWIADGAISMAAATTISGTFIANNGAVDMGDGSFLEGRLLSTAGAVSVYGTTAFIPVDATLALDGLSITGSCIGGAIRLAWSPRDLNTGDIIIQRSGDGVLWNNLTRINEGEKAWSSNTFSFVNQSPASPSFYRMQQENAIGTKEHGAIIKVLPCIPESSDALLVYPNPSTGIFHLMFSGNRNEAYWTRIMNSQGKTVFLSAGIPRNIDISGLPIGLYVVWVKSPFSQRAHSLLKL